MIALIIPTGRPALADEPPASEATSRDRVERAEAHYTRGMEALQAGRYQDALAAYRESYAALPRTQTLYGMAVVAHLTGAHADAANYIASYLERPDRDAALAQKLTGLLAELDRELGRARVEVPGPGPIRVDGRVAGDGPGPLLVRVEPGRHTFRHGTLTITADIEVGQETEVALRPVPVEPSPLATVRSEGSPASLRAWYLTTGGIAIAGLATATYFGLEARAGNRELDRIHAMPGSYQFGDAVDVRDRARRDALVANIAGGVGIASAVATVALILWPRWQGRSDRAPAVTLIPAARGASVEVRW